MRQNILCLGGPCQTWRIYSCGSSLTMWILSQALPHWETQNCSWEQSSQHWTKVSMWRVSNGIQTPEQFTETHSLSSQRRGSKEVQMFPMCEGFHHQREADGKANWQVAGYTHSGTCLSDIGWLFGNWRFIWYLSLRLEGHLLSDDLPPIWGCFHLIIYFPQIGRPSVNRLQFTIITIIHFIQKGILNLRLW